MIRFYSLLLPAWLLFSLALAACAPIGRQAMGDPRNPYPLQAPPQIGQIVHLPTGALVEPSQMYALAGDARIVYFGETHDNPASHRLGVELLRALADRHPGRQALGMEMFSRSQQPALDRWVAGQLNEKEFLRESRWSENWGGDFAYYRDLLNVARARRIPVIALNADRDLVGTLRGKTPDQLSDEERARLPMLDMDDPYHRGMATAVFGDHSHTGMRLEDFIRVQTLWDETMAESVVRYLQRPSGRDMHLLVVAGGNHVSYGFGIPRRVFKRLPVSYLLIGGREIHIPADKQNRLMNVTLPVFPMAPYDFVAYLAYEDLPKTGVRLGVVIAPAPAGQGVLIRDLVPDSSAEKAGLQTGDLLLALDGEGLADPFDLIRALRQKQPGSRGTLRVGRQGKTLTIDVLFTSVPSGLR